MAAAALAEAKLLEAETSTNLSFGIVATPLPRFNIRANFSTYASNHGDLGSVKWSAALNVNHHEISGSIWSAASRRRPLRRSSTPRQNRS